MKKILSISGLIMQQPFKIPLTKKDVNQPFYICLQTLKTDLSSGTYYDQIKDLHWSKTFIGKLFAYGIHPKFLNPK